jgi:hypothetical protein
MAQYLNRFDSLTSSSNISGKREFSIFFQFKEDINYKICITPFIMEISDF